MSPYGVGGAHRHTPEIEQNLSRPPGAPVTVSFTPTLAPMPRGILATCTARATPGTTADGRPRGLGTGLRRRAVRAPAARGPVAAHRPTCSAATPSHLQVALDERAGRVVVVSAVDNLTKGTAGGRRAVPEPRPRPARDDRAADRRGRTVSSHRRRHGFRASGVTAGLKPAAAPTWPSSSTTGPPPRRGASSPATGSRPPRSPGPAGPRRRPGRRRGPQLRRRQRLHRRAGVPDTHPTAEHVADGSRSRPVTSPSARPG